MEVSKMSPHALLISERILGRAVLAALALPICGDAASAGPLAAIVENVDPAMTTIAFMDYLERGRTFDLGIAGWVEIGYLASCMHEKIVGGVVKIGVGSSDVSGGTVERRQVECDSANLAVTESQAVKAAGSAQRDIAAPENKIRPRTGAELRLHGAAPLVVAPGAGEVTISRLADEHDTQTLKLVASNGRGLYDFARSSRSLARGAVYRATFGKQTIVFRVDPEAAAGPSDILGRLILFPPEPP
jgi:hypothetical protein